MLSQVTLKSMVVLSKQLVLKLLMFIVEGASATLYFGRFDDMILQGKPEFSFETRNRRPPLDRVNAMLSFVYSLLAHDCASALESVGLDPYVGFMHRDRPGRNSLALDLMEELEDYRKGLCPQSGKARPESGIYDFRSRRQRRGLCLRG